jgi:hypothetical protein
MKVNIKDFSIDMEIKTKGIELDVFGNDGKRRGDLVVNKANLIWCKGKVNRQNGKTISWDDFIEFMESR